MMAWIEALPERLLHPASLIVTMPGLWVASLLFTESFIGSLILYGWVTVLFVSFLFLLVKEFRTDWMLMAVINTLFFSALFQVLLYISLRMEQLKHFMY